jgi:hypothetical protein
MIASRSLGRRRVGFRRHRSLVAACIVAAVVAGTGVSSAAAPKRVGVALRGWLHARSLSPTWVVCVPSAARIRGRTVFRCNVDFGDPHIQVYCAVVAGGRVRAAEWRQPVRGRQDRAAFQKECARRLSYWSWRRSRP